MKTIYLFDKDKPLIESVSGMDVDLLFEQSHWLGSLPKTKRGNPPFRMHKNKEVLAVIFARNVDATAFRLKFGL